MQPIQPIEACINKGLQDLYILFIGLFILSAVCILMSIIADREREISVPYQITNLAIMGFTYSVIDIYFYQIDTNTILVFIVLLGIMSFFEMSDSDIAALFKTLFWPVSIESNNYLEDVAKVAFLSFVSMFSVSVITDIFIALLQNNNIINSTQIINQAQITKYAGLNVLVLGLVLMVFGAVYSKLEQKYNLTYILYVVTPIVIVLWVYLYTTVCR